MSAPAAQPLPPPGPPPRPVARDPKHDEAKRRAEKERLRKKEEEKRRYEKHKAAEREKAQLAARGKPKPKPEAAAPSNPLTGRLRRDTPFLCNIRFRNDLPEIPCDPKMLVEPLDQAKQSEFFITTLERDPRRDLVLPPDLGIPIGLLNVERYQIPDELPPMDPLDAALLGETAPGAGPRPGRRGVEHSWLLKTTYISNDLADLKTRTVAADKGSKQQQRPATDAEEQEGGAEAALGRILASFKAARGVPVHSRNPALKPVEVLPVLPDGDMWGLQQVLTNFDNDPQEELPQLIDLPPKIKRAKMERSILTAKKTAAGPDGEEAQRFMALLLPREVQMEEEDQEPITLAPGELEGEFDWSKEYTYEMKTQNAEWLEEPQRNYLLRFNTDSATYADLGTRLTLKRRKLGHVPIPRPEKVDLYTRQTTQDEERARAARKALLLTADEAAHMAEDDDGGF